MGVVRGAGVQPDSPGAQFPGALHGIAQQIASEADTDEARQQPELGDFDAVGGTGRHLEVTRRGAARVGDPRLPAVPPQVVLPLRPGPTKTPAPIPAVADGGIEKACEFRTGGSGLPQLVFRLRPPRRARWGPRLQFQIGGAHQSTR